VAELWYYTREGQAMDPVSAEELKRMAAAGKLKPTDMIWKEGMAQWVRASTAKGLFQGGNGETAASPAPASRSEAVKPVREDEWDVPAAAPRRARPADEDEDTEAIQPRRRRPDKAASTVGDDEWDAGEEARQRRARREADDEGEDFEDRPRRKKRKGMSPGAQLAMIIGGVALILVIVGAGVYFLFFRQSAPANPSTWSLAQDGKKTYHIQFHAGKRVEIWVKSKGESDVDLFVFPPGVPAKFSKGIPAQGMDAMPEGAEAFDIGDSQDCYVSFVPRTTGKYEVVVWNRVRGDVQRRNKSNSGTLEFKESDGGLAGVKPGKPFVPPDFKGFKPPDGGFVKPGPDLAGGKEVFRQAAMLTKADPIDPVQGGRPQPGCHSKVFVVQMQAGRTYQIDHVGNTPQFDPYLRLEDEKGTNLATDDDGGDGLNSRIVFRPTRTTNYRLIATTLLPRQTGNFTLTVREN
jgi:hypothetical protein